MNKICIKDMEFPTVVCLAISISNRLRATHRNDIQDLTLQIYL